MDHDEVIEQHLPLVRHIVFQVAVRFPRHVDREELARAGALGLVEAARRYDGSRGVPFERFAAQRVRGAILDAVRSADWAPRSVRNLARALEETSQQLACDLGRAPTIDEVADALATTPLELARLQTRIHRSVLLALDASVDAEECDTLGDTLPDHDAPEPGEVLEDRELHAYLRDAVQLLDERHKLVVIGYFLEGRSSSDLARFLGVTDSRVSQLRTEALALLRDGIDAQYGARRSQADLPVRLQKRRAAFAQALGESSPWRDRLDERTDELVS